MTNPNIQGSNLFVRLSKLNLIGGFDEKLVSTTDRDVCIRLLGLDDISYSILRNHLVHHDASDDPTRLSCPGSTQKREGLEYFFHKYKDIMSFEERDQFITRANNLFNVTIQS